ncbi:malonyl-CoA O-methyltransferase [Thiomicrospira sp. ALE5]|nr:malonyl-CoA O-methyltransferase [Thiomicrospira sp. ALE5]
MINRQHVKHHFSRAASTYDEAAVIQRQVAKDMAERTLLLKSSKENVLELGCGTGLLTEQLCQHYPDAKITAVDLSAQMLLQSKLRLATKSAKWRFWSVPRLPVEWVQADAYSLPFADASFDMLVSNFMLQWCEDLDKVFTEMRRVIRPGGALMFSTFGPDTLKELRQAWLSVEGESAHRRFNDFIDMHDIGDALIRNGFGQPVMDVDLLQLVYDKPINVLKDLKLLGATNAAATESQSSGLLGRKTLSKVLAAYEAETSHLGQVAASFEVVQGHAWAVQEIMKGPNRDKSGVVNITLDELAVELKNRRNQGGESSL